VEPLHEARDGFEAAYPAFRATAALDELRAREFGRFDLEGQVYLDYTGAAPYAASLVRDHARLLLGEILGNPHSASPASRRATEFVEATRARVLRFFNAPASEYTVVFTANATHALKLVGESYPFAPGGTFLLTFDNHNSVNGIREFARARGAQAIYIPVDPPELRCGEAAIERALDAARPDRAPRLFAYPAQSNFSGVQHPLEWIREAHARGWDVLLDAAAFVPTNRLDLDRWRPDFVSVSFYKMFGYPTGVGALVARRSALAKLRRPWFAGGTITVASVEPDRHFLAPGAAAFEDGTVDYANLPAVAAGLDLIERIGVDTIHTRTRCLTGWLLDRLRALRHRNGDPLVNIYGPLETDRRGGTVALNFRDAGGQVIDHESIEARALAHGISLRTGCFCNPGAGELALGLSSDDLATCFAHAPTLMTSGDLRRCFDGRSTGAVRVSVGMATTFADVYAFVQFAETLVQ
jgi:selenocysteine lyase/cysteine desulfurase